MEAVNAIETDKKTDKFTFFYLGLMVLVFLPFVLADIAEKILHVTLPYPVKGSYLVLILLVVCVIIIRQLFRKQWSRSASLIGALVIAPVVAGMFALLFYLLLLGYFYWQVMQVPPHSGQPRYAEFYWDEGADPEVWRANVIYREKIVYDESDKIVSCNKSDELYTVVVTKLVGHFYLLNVTYDEDAQKRLEPNGSTRSDRCI